VIQITPQMRIGGSFENGRKSGRLTEQSRIGFLAIEQKTAKKTIDGGFSGNFLEVRTYSVREPQPLP
jgi:hypothetical protein